MKNKLLLSIMLGIFLIGIVTAGLESFGTFKQGKDIRIKQVCIDATYINISSITYPNSTVIISNAEMISSGSGEFYYDLNASSEIGKYFVTGISDGCEGTFSFYFIITTSGFENTTSSSILLIPLLLILVIFDFFIFYLIFTINPNNKTDEQGNFIGISFIKYIRLFLIGISYGLVIITLNLMNASALQLNAIPQFTGVIGFLFETLLRGAWIWTFVIFLFILVNIIKDSNLKKHIRSMGGINLR